MEGLPRFVGLLHYKETLSFIVLTLLYMKWSQDKSNKRN